MGDLLTRRRGLILASGAPREWDYEWSYSSGKYPDQEGWTKTTGGTASVAFTNGYMVTTVTDTASYVKWTYPQAYSKAVLQVGFRLTTNKAALVRVFLGDGVSSSIGVRANYSSGKHYLYLQDGSTTDTMTRLGAFEYAKTYQLKLVLDNGFGEVWWRNSTDGADWSRVASNVDCSTMQQNETHETFFRAQANGSGATKVNWYTAYMKFNRVS